MPLLFFLLSLCATRGALADESCEKTPKGTEICSVQVSFEGKPRTYKYEIRRPKPGQPVVVEIPGGPGGGYIGHINNFQGGFEVPLEGIPSNFGIIVVDPRGVGLNDFGADAKGGNYSSDLIASDILAVIKKENLQNYVIHGQSFGTIVATKLGAGLAQEKDLTPPKGIVLTGVVHKVFDDQMQGYNHEMSKILSSYTNAQKAKIRKGLKDLIDQRLKGNKFVFDSAIFQALLYSVDDPNAAGNPKPSGVKQLFDKLASGEGDSIKSLPGLDAIFPNLNKKTDFPTERPTVVRKNSMSEEIKCTEMSTGDFDSGMTFDIESLSFQSTDTIPTCVQKKYKLSNPYNSKDFQIRKTPVYYIQGDNDPATPASEAKKHYGDQVSTEKMYVELKGYAHNGMLGLQSCKAGFWEAIADQPEKLKEVIEKCGNPQIQVTAHSKSVMASGNENRTVKSAK